MISQKNNKNFLIDITRSLIVPLIAASCFIIWVFYLFKYPIITFPVIFVIFTFVYVLSGYVYGIVLLTFAIPVAFFVITPDTTDNLLLICETVWLIFVFLRLEHYRGLWVSSKIKLNVENEILDRDITLIQSAIIENENISKATKQKIQTFQKLENIIKTLEENMNSTNFTEVIEEITQDFMGKGKFTIKRQSSKDIFVNYARFNKSPLLISNTKEDNRFSNEDYKDYTSVIVMPIELENNYWGSIKGYTKTQKETFNDYDLRQLSILANILGLTINNSALLKQIETLAITDGLTGLYTKTYFIERLEEEFERAKISNFPISIAIIDIDYFKLVNDTYGHLAGDNFLKQLANILKKRFRGIDILARYGGEEFVVLMLHTKKEECFAILEEVRMGIENKTFVIPIDFYTSKKIKKTISIGLTTLTDEKDIYEFIKRADDALYNAKNSGRNKTAMYN
ncbi:MAG: diguanylate cyclase [Elusimicrobia bacterium]|nr:diguanylate cyclase [Elusimicrobiota bacterium]